MLGRLFKRKKKAKSMRTLGVVENGIRNVGLKDDELSQYMPYLNDIVVPEGVKRTQYHAVDTLERAVYVCDTKEVASQLHGLIQAAAKNRWVRSTVKDIKGTDDYELHVKITNGYNGVD